MKRQAEKRKSKESYYFKKEVDQVQEGMAMVDESWSMYTRKAAIERTKRLKKKADKLVS